MYRCSDSQTFRWVLLPWRLQTLHNLLALCYTLDFLVVALCEVVHLSCGVPFIYIVRFSGVEMGQEWGWAPLQAGFKPPSSIRYWPCQGGTPIFTLAFCSWRPCVSITRFTWTFCIKHVFLSLPSLYFWILALVGLFSCGCCISCMNFPTFFYNYNIAFCAVLRP